MKYIFDPGPDFKGRIYTNFYAAEVLGMAPGWFVLGCYEDYGGRLRKVCARPDVRPRKYKWWNGPVRRGWLTKKEAQAVADQLNKEVLT